MPDLRRLLMQVPRGSTGLTAITSGWRRAAAIVADNHNQLTYNFSIRRRQ